MVGPDLSRRCPAVDPDDHHVFVTMGCAVENLTHAALAHCLHAEARFDAGTTAQMADAAFVKELKSWIRFNGTEALRTGDGLHSAASGSPSIPTWIGNLAFHWVFTPKGENEKYARQIRNSAGLAVFVGAAAGKAHWVDVGRAYERFALQATALGIRNAFLNQPVEVAALRSPFATALGLAGRRPDLVVRFGRGLTLPPSLRRPVQAVMA